MLQLTRIAKTLWSNLVVSESVKQHTQNLNNTATRTVQDLSTALAKNHAKPAEGDTSHVTKMNLFLFFPIDYVLK